MASSVQSAVGLTTSQDLTTYDVRTITKRKSAANTAYVSSLTDGKTFRKAGNQDAGWDISIFSKATETEIPAALRAGQEITVQLSTDGASKKMIIDESTCEVNIETGDLVGISISASAVDANSYPA